MLTFGRASENEQPGTCVSEKEEPSPRVGGLCAGGTWWQFRSALSVILWKVAKSISSD